jgi:hypothetical protein
MRNLIALLSMLFLTACGTAVKPVGSNQLDVVVNLQDVRAFNNPSWFIPKGQRFEMIKMEKGERVVFLTKETFLITNHETGVVLDGNNCSTDKHVSRDYTGIYIHEPKAINFPLDVRTSSPFPFCFTIP